MPKPIGRYLCSEETLLKTKNYLQSLRTGTMQPGALLRKALSGAGADLQKINEKQLIAFLMNTRKPRIFAESEPSLDGSDWNLQENAILGDIVFSTMNTHAFNNGAHRKHQNHVQPLETNFLFVAGALLRNDKKHTTSDMDEVIVDGELDEESFYQLYERRLLPGLLIQNAQAKTDNTPLVINIPGLGCGQFAGSYTKEVKAALPRVLKRFFETHGSALDMVHTVNYDPYDKLVEDKFTTDKVPDTQIRLMARPLEGLPNGAPGSSASQLEFPKDGTNYDGCRLVKIVAWDHFSFPGNDIWANEVAKKNGRATDDGVSFASSDVVLALFNMGQFGLDSPVVDVEYDSKEGIAYAINPKNNQALGYKQLARLYPSEVCVDMIEVLPAPVLSPEERQRHTDFESQKKQIQEKFEQNLARLRLAFAQNTTRSKGEEEELYKTLLKSQAEFFNALSVRSSEKKLNAAIRNFSKSCESKIESADEIMGHGWLYRSVEVTIKAVVGLFAGIGMVVGSVFGQGLVKSKHRQQFANTFFTLNQTEDSQVLGQFKQETSQFFAQVSLK